MYSYRSCDAERRLDRMWAQVVTKAFWRGKVNGVDELDSMFDLFITRVIDVRDEYRRDADVG